MSEAHTGFILAAYAAAVFIVVAMIASIVLDHRSLRRALARLPGKPGGGTP